MADHSIIGHRPSQPVWFCYKTCQKFLPPGQKSNPHRNSLLLWVTHQKFGWEYQLACPLHLSWCHHHTLVACFLQYSNKPSTGHMKAALYTLHYIHSKHNYGISFNSDNIGPMHSFIHYPPPPSMDVKAYNDATPPKPTNSSTLSSYSNTCWGLQIGSTVADGTLIPLIKKSEAWAVVLCSRTVVLLDGLANTVNTPPSALARPKSMLQALPQRKSWIYVIFVEVLPILVFLFCILEINKPTLFYNDNEACIKWSHNMTSKKV